MLKLFGCPFGNKFNLGKKIKKLYTGPITFRTNCVDFGKFYYAYFLLCKVRLMCSKNKLKFKFFEK